METSIPLPGSCDHLRGLVTSAVSQKRSRKLLNIQYLVHSVVAIDSIMDPAKSASVLGSKLQSGEEPISGEEGKGTAEQPYDQGNAEGASFGFASPSC